MKTLKLSVVLLIAAIILLALDRVIGAPGDTPTGPVAITLYWDPNPPAEEVQVYVVRQATNVLGPWSIVATPTTTNTIITLPVPGKWFWFVTASNFWGESVPSNTNSTPLPAGKVQATKISR